MFAKKYVMLLLSIVMSLMILLTLLAFASVSAFAQDPDDISPDIDGDGLLNDLEESGWYNNAGGPFSTDAYDADSDNDGLSDGEEQLYGTNPLDAWSPGLYVRYQDSFRTKQYFSTTDSAYLAAKQGGDRLLLTEAMVARQGTKFFLGGPISATLTITNNGLTDLTPYIEKDLYGGGWVFDLPGNGTVGSYTATVSTGSTSKSMPLHVIFELPTTIITSTLNGFTHTLSAADVEAFLYDDNPANLRDEVAVIWRTSDSNNKGWAQAFWTDQYKRYVFVDRVMPTIHGQTTPYDSVNLLANKADEDVRVDYNNYIQTDMYTTLDKYHDGTGWTQTGSPSENQAGALVSYLRSAGIPANPFIVDWTSTSSDYDTAVLVWVNDEWQAVRSYRGGESGNEAYKYYPFNRGITSMRSLFDWRGQYSDASGDVLVAINSSWDFEEWITDPVDPYSDIFVRGTVGDRWTPEPHLSNDAVDWWWYSDKPLEMGQQSPHVNTLNTYVWQGDGWVPNDWPDAYTLPDPYPGGDLSENWPIEPVPLNCSPGYIGICPYDGSNSGATKTTITPTQYYTFSHQILDSNGNGLYDYLVVDVTHNFTQAGNYRVEGWLQTIGGLPIVHHLSDFTALGTGPQTLSLLFDGRTINGAALNGPYTVVGLKILGDGSNYDVQETLTATNLSLNYSPIDFEPGSRVGIIFSDTLESGNTNWVWTTPWAFSNREWPALNNVWAADGSQAGILSTTATIDASDYTNLTLRFENTYAMSSNEIGNLEVSSDGLNWTKVATYTNASERWKTELLDLSNFDGTSPLIFRFNAQPDTSLLWYIDNFSLSGHQQTAIYLPLILK